MLRRTVTALLRGFYAVFHPIRVEGKQNLPANGPYLLALNHQSFRDAAVALLLTPPDSRFMAKKELFGSRIMAGFLTRLGAFPVDRTGNDLGAVRTAIGALKEGRPLVIFPEGHRFTDGEIHSVKPGTALIASRSAVPVIPARIRTRYLPFQKVRVNVGPALNLPRLAGSEALSLAAAQLEDAMKAL